MDCRGAAWSVHGNFRWRENCFPQQATSSLLACSYLLLCLYTRACSSSSTMCSTGAVRASAFFTPCPMLCSGFSSHPCYMRWGRQLMLLSHPLREVFLPLQPLISQSQMLPVRASMLPLHHRLSTGLVDRSSLYSDSIFELLL